MEDVIKINLFDGDPEEQIKKYEEEVKKQKEEELKRQEETAKIPKKVKIENEEETADTRIVKVYGKEIMTISDKNMKNEDIRKMLAKQYGYPEFTKDETVFKLIYTNKEKTEAILNVGFNFQKKG
ncbi:MULTISPECIES: hypothetical protein [Thermoanaerobacterium]|uniref:Uncharacterized protein n=3 Tax=Thermoanaerobacterium TaxID=28895 RepID=L0INV8_THETR|nr:MULTISPECIES: hypothetical protein [Thermoanaerobacterium]AFK94264.1 hypothetical protein Tsac_2717 [Thermoanaerobacterium saccharolyticum JW/SL-YS485]AGB20439.1 hypothetical protein Thethe_02892 [Thermoanaerobacterium thermosaccharolyticum M0795]ETO39057.1 hypothetical protein V518_0764 [Thermoanaerobacterium aotearoense SCUT27]